jgi:hypothetical protein
MESKKETYPVLTSHLLDINNLVPGLANIKALPEKPKPHSKANLCNGVIALTGRDYSLRVTIAYDRLIPQHISLFQFSELIERMGETLLLQNFRESDKSYGSRGQLLATFCKKRSCFIFVNGVVGKVIRSEREIVKRGEYFIDRALLQTYYIASKCQLSQQAELERLLNTHDGWIEYQIKDLCA